MSTSVPVHRQRILITGASSGLGAGMARRWAGQGRSLALCARRVDELERLRDELLATSPGLTVSVHQLDVTDAAAVPEVFAEATDRLGGLDRVVANAGIGSGGSLGEGHADGNRQVAETNFLGTLHQAEAAVAHFRRVGRGHLAFMSSMSSLRGMGGSMNVYAASKAGIAALAEGLRSDLWDTGIRISSIHPGYVRTSLLRHFPRPILAADPDRAVAAIVAAVDREQPRAYVPAWPWAALALPMRLLPLGLYRRVAG